MRRLAFVVLLALPSLLWADPPALEIPSEVRPSGQYCTLVPKTDAVSVAYIGLAGVDPVPSALLKDARTFLLDTRGLAVGRYRFAAVGASKTGEQARADFDVVIGTPPPTPPGPIPPGPVPPVDPLTAKIQAAYDLAKDPTGLTAMVAFYGRSMTATADAALTTYGQLQARMRQLATETGVRGRLRPVHDLLEKELAAVLPTEVQRPLDDHGRTQARDAFARIHAALQGVKP